MSGRTLSLFVLFAWFGAMIALLRWAFRRRQARMAAGEHRGRFGPEALIVLVVGLLLTVAMAAATMFVVSLP